ncbi:unnamed protein product, partial [Acidocella sp. C78]
VERIAMRDVREIVRLRMAGLSTRQVGIRVGVAASTVRLTLRRLEAAGLDGPGALALSEAALEALVRRRGGQAAGASTCG